MTCVEWVAFLANIATAISAAIGAVALMHGYMVWKEQNRPYVIVDLVQEDSSSVNLVIQNIGKSPALDVAVSSDPPLMDGKRDILKKSFAKPLSFLPPERSLSTIAGMGFELFSDKSPTEYKITVTYGEKGRKKPHSETYVLSVLFLKEKTYIVKDGLNELVAEMKKLNKSLNRQ